MTDQQPRTAGWATDRQPDRATGQGPQTKTTTEDEWDTKQQGDLTIDERIGLTLRRAARRRALAQFQAERGNVAAARQLMRLAVAGELHVASLRGEQTSDEARVVSALLPTWTGTSSGELLATARAVLADRSETL